jgi:hypothetical protein
MVNWFIYNTVLPLLPVPLVYFGAWLIGTRKRVMGIIRDGQLCFYCTSLAAVCVNDIFKSGKQHESATIGLSVAGLILCLILSTFIYGIAATAPATAPSPGSSGVSTADEIKLGFASIATALVTTLMVMQLRYSLGLSE